MPRLLFVCTLALLLTACEVERSASLRPPSRSAPADTLTPAPPDAQAPDAARPSRADAAGLTPEQARTLRELGVPVIVPDLPAGWRVTYVEAGGLDSDGFYAPFYIIRLAHEDGLCARLEAASDGLGDVFVMEPPQQRAVETPRIAHYGPALMGWGEANAEDGWADRLTTEWFGADGYAIQLHSMTESGCRRVTPEAAQTLIGRLQYLDPEDDALRIGPMAYVMDVPLHDAGPDPELVALDVFAPNEAGEGQRTEVETVRRRARHAVVHVTTTGLLDDSVRDERVRVVLVRASEGWSVFQAGRQVRCHAGRGSQTWTAERCT